MLDMKYEISRKLPDGVSLRSNKGMPIFCAFECALLEQYTGEYFIYTAINIETGKSEVLSRRKNPLATDEVEKMADRMRRSKVAGAGRHQADRQINQQISLNKARDILNVVFKRILPNHGFAIREEQIALADHILNEVSRRTVTLAEAEVGTGKTLAYLVPAIIAKRGRLNDFWNMGLYPKMQYADMPKMPIVIATSSIALQRAIMTEYIPELSRILIDSGILMTPLTAVLRKGKEHYVCERNLRAYLAFENDPSQRRKLEPLLPPSETIDLAETDISAYIKKKICVSGRCFDTCHYRETCGYLKFRTQAASPVIDIQVCNHNYLLADTLLRADKKEPLIPNYQMLIIDEAHKFLQAARTMYGIELPSSSAPDVLATVDRLTFKRDGYQKKARQIAKKLHDESARLFRALSANAESNDDEDDAERYVAVIDKDNARHLRNIRNIADQLVFVLRDEAFYSKAANLLFWIRQRYGADITRINLNRIITPTDESGTRESQREIMHSQLLALHAAICGLPEIRRSVEIEKTHRQARHNSKAPEHQILQLDKSVVKETVWKKASRLLPAESMTGKGGGEWLTRLIWDAERIRDQAAGLMKHEELICWLEAGSDENKLCAIPNDLGKRLFIDQWNKGIPTILTSGTLSAGGDFSHIKRTLGLEMLKNRVSETSKPSPFNHRDNALLYISETMPFPDRRNMEYISHTASEVEKLILASHGHAAVLFTSYKVMDMVWELLSKRGLPFPMFRLGKGVVKEIERFKQSKGGVLFASGALWEGIDIPGDTLSMLIIVKLPFAVPDPIGDYEQTLYKDIHEYKARVVVPEMLIKLKQGFGRLIRTETDTGCVAILDSRANSVGHYRRRVLNALPECRVKSSIADVAEFFKSKKPPEYFNNPNSGSFSQVWKRSFFSY